MGSLFEGLRQEFYNLGLGFGVGLRLQSSRIVVSKSNEVTSVLILSALESVKLMISLFSYLGSHF